MTDAAAIETYLHRHIPISREMGVRVISVDASGVRLAAALEPNTNHQSTAFGGSISSLAILAAWSVAQFGLRERGVEARVVIQRSLVDYLKPISGELEAYAPSPTDREWGRLLSGVERRGKGRIRLSAEVTSNGDVAAAFEGLYVALA